MSIPIYESHADRRRQQEVIEFVAKRWSCTPIASHPMAQHDYALCRHDHKDDRLYAHAYAEVKCRSEHRSDYWLSQAKWDYLIDLSNVTDRPAFLIVHCAKTDLVRYAKVDHASFYPKLIHAGRTDRPDDPNAIESMVILPMARFTCLGCLRKPDQPEDDLITG
jgi:hypothetical protein